MPPFIKQPIALESVFWYLKYVALPVTVGASMYGFYCNSRQRKRRAALEGKVVLITGASSGIGEALAHSFYDYGAKVVLAARREAELERVKQDLIAKKMEIPAKEPVTIQLDLGDLGQIDDFVNKVYDTCGTIDILINNGGISFRGSIIHTKIDVDQRIMLVDYFGSVALTKAVLPKMVDKKSGHIVFVSSVQGLIAGPERSAYTAAKHAMQAFGDSLRAEMHQHNINVSMMSPGYVKTAVSLNAITGAGDLHGVMDKNTAGGFAPEAVAKEIVEMVVFKKNDVIYSQFVPRLVIFVRRFAPSFYFAMVSGMAAKTELRKGS